MQDNTLIGAGSSLESGQAKEFWLEFGKCGQDYGGMLGEPLIEMRVGHHNNLHAC